MLKRITFAACVLAPVACSSVSTFGAGVIYSSSSGGTGNAYELFVDPSADSAAAAAAAASLGGNLASITSPGEQTFIENLLINSSAPTGSYWFGLERLSEESFAWSSGEPFSFNHFAAGEPNDYKNGETSGQIYWMQNLVNDTNHRRGGWNDAPPAGYPESNILDLVRMGYIIERPPQGGDVVGASGNGGGTDGGGDGGGPVAIPLPPAVLATPIGLLIAGLAARRRRVAI